MPDYTLAAWEASIAALYGQRGAPSPCPHCRRTGFYGPRQAQGRTRQYRLCRFCGFEQEVGGPAVMLVASVHGCPEWRAIAGAPYIWWVRPDEASYRCPYCRASVDVERARVPPPFQDPAHAWWKVPQGMSHDESLAYWESQGYYRLHM
jgi:hypothetical protein